MCPQYQHIPFLRALIPWISRLVPRLVPNKLLGLVRKLFSFVFNASFNSSETNKQYSRAALRDARRRIKTGDPEVKCVFNTIATQAGKKGYHLSDGQIISDGIVILAAGENTLCCHLPFSTLGATDLTIYICHRSRYYCSSAIDRAASSRQAADALAAIARRAYAIYDG